MQKISEKIVPIRGEWFIRTTYEVDGEVLLATWCIAPRPSRLIQFSTFFFAGSLIGAVMVFVVLVFTLWQ